MLIPDIGIAVLCAIIPQGNAAQPSAANAATTRFQFIAGVSCETDTENQEATR